MTQENPIESPYFDSNDPAAGFKARLLSHLEMLRLPRTSSHNKQPCNKECHLLERGHMIEIVRQFVREN